jgi:hypothetical protein
MYRCTCERWQKTASFGCCFRHPFHHRIPVRIAVLNSLHTPPALANRLSLTFPLLFLTLLPLVPIWTPRLLPKMCFPRVGLWAMAHSILVAYSLSELRPSLLMYSSTFDSGSPPSLRIRLTAYHDGNTTDASLELSSISLDCTWLP